MSRGLVVAIGHCYIWLKTPPPRMWNFSMQLTEDGSQITGSDPSERRLGGQLEQLQLRHL